MSSLVIGIILGSLSAVCWGISDFIARGATRRTDPAFTLLCVLTVGGVGIAGYALPAGLSPMTPSDGVLVIATGLLALGGYLALYHAFKVGLLSVVSSIASCNSIIPVLLALIVLGERPLLWQYGGIVLVLVGVVFLSQQGGAKLPQGTHQLGLPPALLSMVLFGLSLFCMKLAVDRIDPETVALTVRIVGISALGLWMALTGKLRWPPKEVQRPLLAAGLLDALAFILFAEALTHTMVSLVAPISSTIPVVTVTLAWLVLKERMGRLQWVGLACTMGGVALVAMG